MTTPFLYADFLKTLANTEIHNTTTIVNHGQEIGLLQKRFEEIQEGQLKKDQGVEEAKKVWSEDLAGPNPKTLFTKVFEFTVGGSVYSQ